MGSDQHYIKKAIAMISNDLENYTPFIKPKQFTKKQFLGCFMHKVSLCAKSRVFEQRMKK